MSACVGLVAASRFARAVKEYKKADINNNKISIKKRLLSPLPSMFAGVACTQLIACVYKKKVDAKIHRLRSFVALRSWSRRPSLSISSVRSDRDIDDRSMRFAEVPVFGRPLCESPVASCNTSLRSACGYESGGNVSRSKRPCDLAYSRPAACASQACSTFEMVTGASELSLQQWRPADFVGTVVVI